MLLVMILHMRSSFGWHLSNFMVLLRQQLFVYRDLWKWIDDPFQAPETPPIPQLELELVFAWLGQQNLTTRATAHNYWTILEYILDS
jgi:hypothetical protein